MLLLLLLPSSYAFFFNSCCQQSYYQPSYQQSYPQQYYPQQSYYLQQYQQPQQYSYQQQGYVQAPAALPAYRTPQRQYAIPSGAYHAAPPAFRPVHHRNGYGTIPVHPIPAGARASYVTAGTGGHHSVKISENQPARHAAVIQPQVDEEDIDFGGSRQTVVQPPRPVEKLFRQIEVTPYEPTSTPAPHYEPRNEESEHVVESTSEFSGDNDVAEDAITRTYPIEEQGYDAISPPAPITPYEPIHEFTEDNQSGYNRALRKHKKMH